MSPLLRIIPIVAVAAILAGWLGYRQAYNISSSKGVISGESGKSDRRQRPIEKRGDKAADLRRLLDRPANSRTSDEGWAIISKLSIRQIKDVLATLPRGKELDPAQDQEMMLYFCWAQIDPLEALEAAGRESEQNNERATMLRSAFTAWMRTDPDAAYQWAMQSPSFDKRVAFRQMAKLLALLPAEESLEKGRTYGPEVTTNLLSRLGGSMVATPEDRAAFLDILRRNGGEAGKSDTILRPFIRTWGAADPPGALAGLKDLPMDERTRENFRRQVTTDWTEQDPGSVIAWMTSADNPQPLKDRVQMYREWAESDPEEASQEFENLSRLSPGFRDEIMKSLLTSYHQGGRVPSGRNADSDRRLFSNLKIHYDQWNIHDPERASAWAETLDPALRQRLQTQDLHEKD
jgi:hypothetical protein